MIPVGLALTLTFLGAAMVTGLVFWAGWELLGVRGLKAEKQLSSKTLFDLVKLAFGVAAGAGALVALVVAYRRQRVDEAAALREATRLHTERFSTAVGQLGETSPAVQLGGVHALAALADDAPTRDLRQSCIDVLCAYLRLPYDPEPQPFADDTNPSGNKYTEELKAFRSVREIRHTIIRLIGNHLRLDTDDPRSWSGHDFDFTDVVFDGGDLHSACFTGGNVSFQGCAFINGRVDFRQAEFSGGKVDFGWADFSGGRVDFRQAEFSGGKVDFDWAKFSGGKVDFGGAKFSGGEVSFDWTKFSGGEVDFSGADFSGGRVDFLGAELSGGEVSFLWAEFSGGKVDFRGAKFSGGEVDFLGAELSGGEIDFRQAEFSGGEVDFGGAKLSGGKVDFRQAEFPGGKVGFREAKFSGVEVDFREAKFSGGRVDFSQAEGQRPNNLPTSGQALRLPRSWQATPHDPAEAPGPDDGNS
ncbi:pentapeptide repeat-containing protein [Actinocorallia aurantiaca]|uniref:pentapeptide repeat-containing protein n=1 Tax=Actinocorallia aurantiaca TaxID=46204 RepID=UPI0031D3A00F